MAIDTQGNKVWERELDIYGKVRKLQGDKWFMPFLYQGQYYDVETELAYNRFRYYSPDTGAYISQDPIGLAGNNPNIYAYVWDTNTWIDVFGLLGKTYIVYQAIDLDTGKIYTGRTSGDDNLSIRQILDKRQSGHHRNLGQLQEVFVTNSYEAVRGGEQYYIEEMRKKGMATDQINGIAERNFGKNGAKKKGDLYMEAFHAENNKKKITCSE
ncbi:type IV secretion protein Rhs [Capnocytophaga canis]|uniref:Type IV secretion protein Rhs n=2 Tax=Capnocytophaga canis TaxID=1848903 RepID=A0A3A1YD54_9FLAO|nr:type IV secretion protein Rhs [Capnocytophaga canis]